ncbi:MAG TPA: HAD family hydrolase [Nocardioides sp.]|jgi:HAD superfamily hydrolase (TIGR01549 family)|uniref:HAD family hydrolase n=1 Tax=Nocardioides sp. TaxID=35761 RepID=UPI002CE0D9D7|nr:HAD family hydrolase [Nocardioides sp.]HTW15498.1 HAD family hydrolase [Nocardioides sp.]
MSHDLDTAIVDIDGTLLDSNYHHTLAWVRAFAHVGITVPGWRIHRHLGMGGDRLVGAVAGDGVEERHGDEVRERWEREYDEIIDETRLLDGARDLLDALGDAGLTVVLASSSIPRHAEHALELLDAGDRAAAWTTAEDASATKPDPELLDAALDRVGGGRAVMLGDSVWDVAAANERGIPTIGLRSGGVGAAELREAGAVAVYDDPRGLTEHLREALDQAARAGRSG